MREYLVIITWEPLLGNETHQYVIGVKASDPKEAESVAVNSWDQNLGNIRFSEVYDARMLLMSEYDVELEA